ncbi:MAG: hypothetical protein Q4A31_07125 [Corynebacterium sp.]|uniref:hypothetical protein n=1 Tax=Corynebacterium sp. TaxID=1720 RepID=UPI0026DC7191|nr:hypothetical protein [Corynebacterium sp.]MDO4761672.1 hypothetical protein [Corynebacterium sp.]
MTATAPMPPEHERAEAVFTTDNGRPMNARDFAVLVTNISQATTATAKAFAAKSGVARNCGRPLVLTPTATGFSLAAAPRPKRPNDIELDFAVRDADDTALCQVLSTLFGEGTQLENLPHQAQQATANAARVLQKKRNAFHVRVQQRGMETRHYVGNCVHAESLVAQFREEKVLTTIVEDTFLFDGFKDSSDTVFLMMDGTSQAVSATEELVRRVQELLATMKSDQHLQLACRIEQVQVTKPGRKPKISRTLLDVEKKVDTKVGEQFTLLF